MTVYNFNRGIGWASSGVEYAQMYRAQVFRRIGVMAKFIFTDMFRLENMEAMTKAIGFRDEEIIWLYQYFTDFHPGPCTVTEEELMSTFGEKPVTRQVIGDRIQYGFQEKNTFITAIRTRGSGKYIQRAEHVVAGCLIRTDYYTYGKIFSEFFAPEGKQAKLYLRRFYNTDGSTAYEEFIHGERSMFRMGGDSGDMRIIDSKERLIGYLVQSLRLTDEDVVICDRSTEIGRGLFENRGSTRMAIIIHADHYNNVRTDDRNILWNNFYEYDFAFAGERNVACITSTEEQARVLREQFRHYRHEKISAVTIPVGALEKCVHPDAPRKPFSLCTASRLATEKHVDWIIDAVLAVRKKYPDVTLDIYGRGGEEKKLRDKIERAGAGGYIRLMGHQDLEKVYGKYEVYVSGSTSEGFGLTLMEAVGSGLAMVGFDVPYGNITFIKDGENGFLVPYEEGEDERQASADLAGAIERIFEGDRQRFSENSYQIAETYLSENIEQRWKRLLEMDRW